MNWTVQGQLLKIFALPLTDLLSACAQIQLSHSLHNWGCLAGLSGKAKAERARKGGILSCGPLEEDLRGDHRGVLWNQQNMLLGVHMMMYHCFLLDANSRQLILIIFHQKVKSLCIFIQVIPMECWVRERWHLLVNVTTSSGCRAERTRIRKLNV